MVRHDGKGFKISVKLFELYQFIQVIIAIIHPGNQRAPEFNAGILIV